MQVIIVLHDKEDDKDKIEYSKVLVFVGTKAHADCLFEILNSESEISVIHSSKEQNHRTKSIDKFVDGTSRILIATDVIARGIDIEKITAVISFNTPLYPENYIHRIGRTARAGRTGIAYGFCDDSESGYLVGIQQLIGKEIPVDSSHEFHFIGAIPKPGQKAGKVKDPNASKKKPRNRNRSNQGGGGNNRQNSGNGGGQNNRNQPRSNRNGGNRSGNRNQSRNHRSGEN